MAAKMVTRPRWMAPRMLLDGLSKISSAWY